MLQGLQHPQHGALTVIPRASPASGQYSRLVLPSYDAARHRAAAEFRSSTSAAAPGTACNALPHATRHIAAAAAAAGGRLNANSSSSSSCSRALLGVVTTAASARQAVPAESELTAMIRQIPFKRLAIWASVGLAAYQLSDFFGIMMGTFVVAFLGQTFVDSTQHSPLLGPLPPGSRRKGMVLLYFTLIFALVTLFGVMTIPGIANEAVILRDRLSSDNIWVVLVEKTRAGLGDHVMESVERALYLANSKDISALVSNAGLGAPAPPWTTERSVQLGMAVSSMLKGYTTAVAKVTGQFLSSATKFAVQIVVSLVFSFIVVWDGPAIAAGLAKLRDSRLAPIYHEVAPVLSVFGKLFGKALEAQARIALVNTALTLAGMWALAIPSLGLLSLFVFLCSFIPIAGCIISTVPIGFVALTEYGFFKLALVILMVVAVHFVEAYFLNPAIYSAHLKLHPLLVLSVLVVAEHSIGIWGLLLAVPLTVFLLDYCITMPAATVTEVGQKGLERVASPGAASPAPPSALPAGVAQADK